MRGESTPIRASLLSPVDGTVSAIGHITDSQLVQAKGRSYSLAALLAGSQRQTDRFVNGTFATLYLAPFNYHRIHMPCDGTLQAAWYVPGRLFSVNATTAAAVSNLFARNERVVCVFDDAPLGFALIMVGALFVGSMSTRWHGDVTPAARRRLRELKPQARDRSATAQGSGARALQHGLDGDSAAAARRGGLASGLAAGSRVEVGRALARRCAP